MVNDAEARKAVRQLMERFDVIGGQLIGLAYVLAKRDSHEYAQLLEAADKAIATVVQPVADNDVQRRQVYAALDDPNAEWCKAVMSMLSQGPVTLTLCQAIDQLRLRSDG